MCSEHALSLIENYIAKSTAIMCSSNRYVAIARFDDEVPGYIRNASAQPINVFLLNYGNMFFPPLQILGNAQ